ncbi:MAG: ATP-dependent helicase [Herminiimonas sp.]|nr:ATP-dependent helicase [Herminiimonas sp.]
MSLTAALAPASDPFASLNDDQRTAVDHDIGCVPDVVRPLLVVAGAGSGKTSTLAHRVARLIVSGIDPQRILLLTFSRRAAGEMARRTGYVLQRVMTAQRGAGVGSGIGSMRVAEAPAGLAWAGTFHGIGARLLQQYASHIGLTPGFTIHDRGDAEDLMGLVRHAQGLSGTAKRFPLKSTCLAIYSRVVNAEVSLTEVLKTVFPWCGEWETELNALFAGYVDAKEQQNVLDYDDLLLFWADMLSDAVLAQDIGARFDHVLVDEYQDTNRLQATILQRLKPRGQGVMVVGDDAQSIYSFRGATVRNILDFEQQFTQAVRVVTLQRNYRSTQPILDASNAVIAAAVERHAKTLWTDRASTRKPELVLIPDEAEQARWVANRVLEHRESGIKLKAQAVLFRTATHSAALELELVRRNIPFVKFGGLKFLEATHIKDLLSLLRFTQNPGGRIAGFRLLQLIPGIGPTIAGRILDLVAAASDAQAALAAVAAFKPPAAAAGDWRAFVDVLEALRPGSVHAAWPAELALACDWYLPHLQRLHDDAEVRAIDLDQLVHLAAGYASRERFLAEITLDPPEATSDRAGVPLLDEDYLILSTIHSAKGQEWTSVHVLNVVDGCLPSDLSTGSNAELDEERRLLYVAMTRAKDYLHLIVPQKFFIKQQSRLGDRHVLASRTRFITTGMLKHFEQCVWFSADTPGARTPMPDSVRMAVRERARKSWQS